MRNILFPRICLGCKKQGDYLCKDCKRKLEPFPDTCPICHRFSSNYDVCLDCKVQEKSAIAGLLIGFVYSDFLKKLILKLKYQHKKDVAHFLAERLALVISTNPKIYNNLEKTIISFIPSHWHRKYFVKGYNQSELIAHKTAENLSILCVSFLRKKRNTKSQVGLTKAQREKNLQSAFVWRPKFDYHAFDGIENIIFIDDITTTGATIHEIATVVKKKYPTLHVYGCVVGKIK